MSRATVTFPWIGAGTIAALPGMNSARNAASIACTSVPSATLRKPRAAVDLVPVPRAPTGRVSEIHRGQVGGKRARSGPLHLAGRQTGCALMRHRDIRAISRSFIAPCPRRTPYRTSWQGPDGHRRSGHRHRREPADDAACSPDLSFSRSGRFRVPTANASRCRVVRRRHRTGLFLPAAAARVSEHAPALKVGNRRRTRGAGKPATESRPDRLHLALAAIVARVCHGTALAVAGPAAGRRWAAPGRPCRPPSR